MQFYYHTSWPRLIKHYFCLHSISFCFVLHSCCLPSLVKSWTNSCPRMVRAASRNNVFLYNPLGVAFPFPCLPLLPHFVSFQKKSWNPISPSFLPSLAMMSPPMTMVTMENMRLKRSDATLTAGCDEMWSRLPCCLKMMAITATWGREGKASRRTFYLHVQNFDFVIFAFPVHLRPFEAIN